MNTINCARAIERNLKVADRKVEKLWQRKMEPFNRHFVIFAIYDI